MTNDSQTLYHGHDLDALGGMNHYHRWIVNQFVRYLHGHVAEFGAGVGSITQLLLPHVRRLDVIEPSPNLIDRLGQRFRHDDRVQIHGESLERYVPALADNALDAVVLVNVLEHIEHDVGALADLSGKIKPGGHLLIFVPALQFLMSKLDRDHGHFRRYHRGQLIRLVRDQGFDVVEARYMDLAGIMPWLLFNTLGGSTKFNPRMVSLYDRMVPWLERFESVLRPPVGKNVVLIARRPPMPEVV